MKVFILILAALTQVFALPASELTREGKGRMFDFGGFDLDCLPQMMPDFGNFGGVGGFGGFGDFGNMMGGMIPQQIYELEFVPYGVPQMDFGNFGNFMQDCDFGGFW